MLIENIRPIIQQHEPVALGPEHDHRGQAAVLVPLIDHAAGPTLLLTERASSLSSHGGEVAFPGGKADPEDESLIHTALRENAEELGIAPGEVEMFGPLRPFVSKFGLTVTPFVGCLAPAVAQQPNPDEIASVFEVPLSYFREAEPIRFDELDRHGEQHSVPAFLFSDRYEIWGLTAMIVVELLRAIEQSGR